MKAVYHANAVLYFLHMERSYSRYILVVLCVSIVMTAIVLVALNAYTKSKTIPTPALQDDSADAYRAGFAAAKARFEQYGLNVLAGQNNVLIGDVKSVSSAALVVTQENLMTDEIVSGVSNDRTVRVTAETAIVQETPKPAAQFEKEQDAFSKLPPGTATEPPNPTVRTMIRLADIKNGDRVRVTASEPDITTLESVNALEIVVTK
jgi:hypothetical protein